MGTSNLRGAVPVGDTTIGSHPPESVPSLRRVARAYGRAVRPPSTGSATPVTNEAASEQSQMSDSATSSG